jgi:hypothetical protein
MVNGQLFYKNGLSNCVYDLRTANSEYLSSNRFIKNTTMLRYLLALILLIHALIHLIGFIRSFGMGKLAGTAPNTSSTLLSHPGKPAGLFWLMACILFLVSVLLVFLQKEWWWMVGIAALALSQVLIILFWKEARWGTIVNGLTLVALLFAYSGWQFSDMVRKERTSFLQVGNNRVPVTEDLIKPLPPLVQSWLRRSGVVGKPMNRTAYLKQKGEMRTAPDKGWKPFTAEQYFTLSQPAFLWTAKMQLSPFLSVVARDKYYGGKGNMLVKAASLITIADSRGATIDQGSLLRYLAEITWFPSAALSPYIKWEAVDDTSVKATITYGGISASGVLGIDAHGDVTGFTAMRYYERKEGPTLESWCIRIDKDGYRQLNGLRIPAKSTVTWKLKEGDFTWMRVEVTELEGNGKSE